MQKLVFINGNGKEIDLTSGNFGITNWEGFANTALNIQTQQVPFEDGGVYLDALMEQREIAVTVAIYDGNNLELRYQKKRELISALNPKLGEGVLIYTNDYLSRQIHAVPQIPIFENKNSNDVGTLKASVAFTCPNPYWEDIEETIVDVENFNAKEIENEGDVPTQVEMDFYSAEAQELKIENIQNEKSITYNNTLQGNLYINTNYGKKSAYLKKLDFNTIDNKLDITGMAYSQELQLYIYTCPKGFIFTSYNRVDWEAQKSNCKYNLYDVIYSAEKKLFVVVGENGTILTSHNGIDWTTQSSGVSVALMKARYIKELQLFYVVGYNGTILKSSDGEIWEDINSGINDNLLDIAYSEDLTLFNVVGLNGSIHKSSDGENWVQTTTQSESSLRTIIYNSKIEKFIIAGGNGRFYYSTNGDVYNAIDYERYRDIARLFYSDYYETFFAIGEAGSGNALILQSYDGVAWSRVANITTYNSFNAIAGDLFLMIGGDNGEMYKYSGDTWEIEKDNPRYTYALSGVAYSDKTKIYVAISPDCLYTSEDGKNWEINNNYGGYDIIYVPEKEKFFFARTTKLYASEDGINWEVIYENPNTTLGEVFYANGYLIVTGTNGYMYYSNNLISWSTTQPTNISFRGIAYSQSKKMYIACTNGAMWKCDTLNGTWQYTYLAEHFLTDCVFVTSLNKYIAIGEYGLLIISNDGENWETVSLEITPSLLNILYVSEQGCIYVVGAEGVILQSYDGVNWEQNTNINGYPALYGICYNKNLNELLIAGYNFIIIKSEAIMATNVIQNLSANTNMNFNLEIGKNIILLSSKTGNSRAVIRFRNKYIGV